MAVNKKYDQTDSERDQSRRLEQNEAERQKARREEMPGRRQQHANDDPRRQQGGWTTDEDGDSVRDSDSGEKLVDEP
ncbi:hypothetical protein D8676_23770 [Mesorhizobium sp. YM1C-6-2]|nr:hypothetical protein D8676_23770 [Mesorhizobium sp. YM1C-6-2]